MPPDSPGQEPKDEKDSENVKRAVLGRLADLHFSKELLEELGECMEDMKRTSWEDSSPEEKRALLGRLAHVLGLLVKDVDEEQLNEQFIGLLGKASRGADANECEKHFTIERLRAAAENDNYPDRLKELAAHELSLVQNIEGNPPVQDHSRSQVTEDVQVEDSESKSQKPPGKKRKNRMKPSLRKPNNMKWSLKTPTQTT